MTTDLSTGAALFSCHSSRDGLLLFICLFTPTEVQVHTGMQTPRNKSQWTKWQQRVHVCCNKAPFHFPLCAGPRAGSSTCLFSSVKSVSGRLERLSSPSVFVGVRDSHSNGRVLTTGDPDEEQSIVEVLLPYTYSALCDPPPPGNHRLSPSLQRGGGRGVLCGFGRVAPCVYVCVCLRSCV